MATNAKPTAMSIISGLGGNTSTGMCLCPAHDDKTPSLHVSDGPHGKTLLHCHARCPQDAVIDALRARGLWRNGTRPAQAAIAKPRQDDAEARYQQYERFRKAISILRAARKGNAFELASYLGKRGINSVPPNAMLLPVAECRHLLGMGFSAMVLPVVKNGKLVGAHATLLSRDRTKRIKNGRRMFGPIRGGYVPLGEPEPGKPLIVAEGIETALSASLISGYPAIAALSATNMKALSVPSCSEIIIAADNDDVGLEAAEKLAERLYGQAVRIAVPDERDGYDWNDALTSGTDLETLRKSIVSATRHRGAREVRALSVEAFMALEFPKRQYLIEPWLATSSLAMIHAQRGAAKTWLALSVAYAVATGEPLLGWEVKHIGRVLYVDGELPGRLLQNRLQQFGPYPKNLRVLSPDLFLMQGALMPDLGEEAGRDFLDEMIERNDIDLVILDSLSTLVRSGVENEAGPWVPIQAWALKHRWRGRTIIFVHHEGRNAKPRGTSKREDVLDTMVGLKPRPELAGDDESAFELKFTKSREFYGADAAPMVVRLSIASGQVEWRHETVGDSNRDRIATLLEKGWKQADIAKELDLTPGRVSQIAKEIRRRQFAGEDADVSV